VERLESKDVDALAKVRAKRIKTADVLHEFRGKIKDAPDGRRFKVDLDRRGIDKMREMRRPYARAASALSQEWAAQQAKIRVVSPRGGVMEIAADCESTAAAQGFLPDTARKLRWNPVRQFELCPRLYFKCGHYTETKGEAVCPWCAEEQ